MPLGSTPKVATDNIPVPSGVPPVTLPTLHEIPHHKRALNEGVKHPCRKCNHQGTLKGNLAQHKRAVHE